ncbi:hypothetical protein [Caldisericum sp.]|uniref:hypothetical protein n=1 Tax=Caldisericum sp. TaxID=2499687 RepID=UPI003D0AC12A
MKIHTLEFVIDKRSADKINQHLKKSKKRKRVLSYIIRKLYDIPEEYWIIKVLRTPNEELVNEEVREGDIVVSISTEGKL